MDSKIQLFLFYFCGIFVAASCQKPVMACFDQSSPPSIPNSICELEASEMQAFTRWRCRCALGYSLENSQRNLVFCYADNTTSPDLPACRKSCLVPTPYNGRWINVPFGSEILDGDSVVERCLDPPPGLKQTRILQCRDGFWSSVWLSHSCQLERCDPTPHVAGSYSRCFQAIEPFNETELVPMTSTRISQCFEGGQAVFWCKEGYRPETPNGKHRIAFAKCGFGGKWGPIIPFGFHCEFVGYSSAVLALHSSILLFLSTSIIFLFC